MFFCLLFSKSQIQSSLQFQRQKKKKKTFPEAGGVLKLNLEPGQVLKAAPEDAGAEPGAAAVPAVPGAGCTELCGTCLPLNRAQKSHDAAVPFTPRFWRNQTLSPGRPIHSFSTGTKTRFQLKPKEIRLERWKCQITSHSCTLKKKKNSVISSC